MKRVIISVLLLLSMVVLGACTDDYNAAEDMYDHLEKSVELESSFQQSQSDLVKLEEEENELYDQMMEINMNELDKIQGMVDEALGLVEERRQLLEQEKESIDAAKEEFDQAEQYVEDLDEEPKKLANQMIEKMDSRFQSFNDLYKAYQKSLDLDAELYEMLKNQDLKKEELDQQVEEVNASYEKVKKAQKEFNTYTKEFNELKRKFYEASGLNVEYQED
ncbi:hypothetical protein E3U55_14785 [Filobacillus milosensis]|uniref:Cell-wall binding lipoprotein n=1 Tax=Filobacillus milosensis TaxID=94137 RepID=A0A4Y8IDM6_9BACI|nr:YkyA family protein [Filobacillus milosensis]TFB14046.1 hypothetical protein E3U55_14785 [Filobacillus milosensis]